MRAEPRNAEGAVPVRMIFGLLIAALGAIFLAESLGWVEGRELLRRFWPAAFVALGVAVVLQPETRGASRFWGFVPILAGIWIFAYQEEWIEVDFWDLFFPAILLVFGGSLVWRAYQAPRERPVGEGGPPRDADAYVRAFAVMAGNEIRSTAKNFRGAELGAFMGGVVLDLTGAEFEGDSAAIDVFAMWAGIEIKVEPGVKVVSKVIPLMGAFEDKTPPPTRADGAAPGKTLLVRGFVVMGGVEVKG
jgi:hypothetical protein